jgi:pimeloyl-ACP methyl ester carboxylesterase
MRRFFESVFCVSFDARSLRPIAAKLTLGSIKIFVLSVAFLLGACAAKLPVTTPIDSEFFNSGKGPSPTLIVLLPGIDDQPETFREKGFISAVRERNINADLVAVRAHFGYYQERKIVPRLNQDVILPAQAMGYRSIWLVGISLGGWGSVLFAQQHQQAISGMLLLAPFLGERNVFAEIQTAGGLDAWRPATVHPEDDQRLGLAWLADFKQAQAPLKRFAKPNSLIAARLPADQVQVIAGGHDWRTWLKLWQAFLDKKPFQ